MKQKRENPRRLIIHFSEKCKQILTPNESFFKDSKGNPRIPTLDDWKEIAHNIINGKEYLRYETTV